MPVGHSVLCTSPNQAVLECQSKALNCGMCTSSIDAGQLHCLRISCANSATNVVMMTRNSRACIKPQQPLRKGARTYMDIYRYSNTMPNYKYSNTMLRQGLSVRDLAWRCWAIQEHRCGQPCVHASARHILDVPGIYDAICPQLSHNQELAPIVTQLSNWHRARRHHSISTISVNPPRALA